MGSYLVDELLAQGHRPRLLVRPGSDQHELRLTRSDVIAGDLADKAVLRRLIAESDAVVYNIGILRAFPKRGITFGSLQFDGAATSADLATYYGVRRFLLMSANGVDVEATEYQRTKFAAEEHVQAQRLDWTVFRPSVIFGDPRGKNEFATMLKRVIIDSPLPAPLFYTGLFPAGAGAFRLSPVHVRNVAAAFVGALESRATYGQRFTLGGARTLSWKEILTTIARACGKRKLMLPIPSFGPSLAAALLDRYPWFPISRGQISMLTAGNSCKGDKIFGLLGIDATAFDESSLKYLTSTASTLPTTTETKQVSNENRQ